MNHSAYTRLYQEKFALGQASFEPIHHDEAFVAIVYKVATFDGKTYIIKICDRKNDYLREIHFLQVFAGLIPVPTILKTVPPDGENTGAILMEYLPGSLLEKGSMTQSLATTLGSILASIHQKKGIGYGDPIQSSLHDDPASYLSEKFAEGIDECKDHLPARLIIASENYYQSHLHLLQSLDGPCVVHRDFRPGNIIINQGNLQGIIDWSGARISFAEEDLCAIEDGNWLKGCKKAFFAGYQSVRLVPPYKHLLLLLRLNKAIATIGFTIKKKIWKKEGYKLYQSNRQLLEILVNNQ